jgi:AraC-like DNA-binding protein
VAEIGAAAGYSHAQDFIRAYRRAHGKSPGEEREESRMAGRARLSRPTARLPLWAQWVREIA